MNSSRLPSTTQPTNVLNWLDSTRLVEGDTLRQFATASPWSGDDSRVVRLQAVCELGTPQHRDLSTDRHTSERVSLHPWRQSGGPIASCVGLALGGLPRYQHRAPLPHNRHCATRRVWGTRWSGDKRMGLHLVGPEVRERFAHNTPNDSAKRLILTLSAPTQADSCNQSQGLFSTSLSRGFNLMAWASRTTGVAAGLLGFAHTGHEVINSGELLSRGADWLSQSRSSVAASACGMSVPAVTSLSDLAITCTGTFNGGQGLFSTGLRQHHDSTTQKSQHGEAAHHQNKPRWCAASGSLFFLGHTPRYTDSTQKDTEKPNTSSYIQEKRSRKSTAFWYSLATQNTLRTASRPLYTRAKQPFQILGTHVADLDLRSLSPLRREREILREKMTDALLWGSAVICQGMT